MNLRLFLAGLTALLLLVAPASAQSTCSDCVGSGSDIAGALFQGDAAAWASADAQSQLNERAVLLNAFTPAAPPAHLSPGAVQAFSAAPHAHALLTRPAVSQDTRTALHAEWTAHGLPDAAASALLDALAGLTAHDRVQPDALLQSLVAYNAAVQEASPDFVTAPAPSFLAVRHALALLTPTTP